MEDTKTAPEENGLPTFTVTERYLIARALLPQGASVRDQIRSHNIRTGFEITDAEKEKMGVSPGAEHYEVTQAMEEAVGETGGGLSEKEINFLGDCIEQKSQKSQLPNNEAVFGLLLKMAPYNEHIREILEEEGVEV